jgi:hypothetical protein
LIDGRHNGPGHRIGMHPGMNGFRSEFHGLVGFSFSVYFFSVDFCCSIEQNERIHKRR